MQAALTAVAAASARIGHGRPIRRRDVRRLRRMGPMPAIDTHLVRRLVDSQFPQWADLPVSPVEHGGVDNRTFRLGERMTVRLPSADGYALQVDKEQRWLPILAPQLPLPIPTPVARGAPGEGYPHAWSVHSWLTARLRPSRTSRT